MQVCLSIPYSRKLSRKKTFANFSFVAVCESFLHEIWRCGILWRGTSKQSTKVCSTKIIFFTDSRKFSPSKVSRYTVIIGTESTVIDCESITKDSISKHDGLNDVRLMYSFVFKGLPSVVEICIVYPPYLYH